MASYLAGSPAGVYVGDQVPVIGIADNIIAGFKSRAIAIGETGSARPATLRAQVDFNASPGTFELDLQESDTDQDNDYQTVANVAANTGAPNYSCYIQYVNPTGRFYRLYAKTMGSTVASGATGTLSV